MEDWKVCFIMHLYSDEVTVHRLGLELKFIPIQPFPVKRANPRQTDWSRAVKGKRPTWLAVWSALMQREEPELQPELSVSSTDFCPSFAFPTGLFTVRLGVRGCCWAYEILWRESFAIFTGFVNFILNQRDLFINQNGGQQQNVREKKSIWRTAKPARKTIYRVWNFRPFSAIFSPTSLMDFNWKPCNLHWRPLNRTRMHSHTYTQLHTHRHFIMPTVNRAFDRRKWPFKNRTRWEE